MTSSGGAASLGDTYCLCGQPYAPGQFMIECDCCREWFHGGCVNVKIYQSEDIDKYHCPKCVPTYGSSIYKVPTNNHRQDRYELHSEGKPIQTGSCAFIQRLASRSFSSNIHILRMDPKHFTEAFIKEKGLTQPVLFENPAGLDLRVPPASTFTVRTVERHCGADREIDVIDVTRQNNFKMPLGDFVDYFTETNRSKVLNVLSLEFSDTSMSGLVQPPLMARQLDWVKVVWPSSAPPFSPLVQKYCIMSAATAYTDFHIDFGGTTVWYHVLHGQKIFYIIPPTPTNLQLYQEWSVSSKQNEIFFGDLVESCSMCILKRGQTVFIPTGWIHAVLTPEDSLVFGGNFLHSYNIELQLQINEIEKQVETPTMFRFPLFESIHWYAGLYLLQQLRRVNEEQQDEDFTIDEKSRDGFEKHTRVLMDFPPSLIRGIRVLTNTLKDWNASKSFDSNKKLNIPDSVNSGQLIRDLSRELRRLEKILVPPSPNSNIGANKKKKKKPKPQESIDTMTQNRYFSSVSKDQQISNSQMSVAMFDAANPRSLYNNQTNAIKKTMKLTIPKPIMHVADHQMFSNSSQDSEDAELSNIASMASKSGIASYNQNYDSQDSFGESDYQLIGDGSDSEQNNKRNVNTFVGISNERNNTTLKLKPLPATSIRNGPPPDYASAEHSILKSHLINNPNNVQRNQKPSNQWTISKSQIKNSQDSIDEQILFTNENLALPGPSQSVNLYTSTNYEGTNVLYGPGMYSGESGNQNIGNTVDSYNPDFIVDRKVSGLGLPDYSPTKSMNDYLVGTKPTYSQSKSIQNNSVVFANNSDPYSQNLRSQDMSSPYSDDSSVLTGTDTYKIKEDNKANVMGFTGSDEYLEMMNRKRQRTLILGEDNEHREKNYLQPFNDRGHTTNTNDQIYVYESNTHSTTNVNSGPPPPYESVVPRRTDRPTRRRVDPRSSIYTYEDQDDLDENDLYIDEAPKSSRRRRKPPPIDKNPLKITIPSHAYRQGGETNRDSRVPENFAAPKNGIESLLQASAFTGSAGTDNQEREAVVGMLTIGQSYGLARADSSRRSPLIEGPPIRAVHKDDEYVYPSLEMSSDDEDNFSPPRRSSSRSKRRRHPFSSPTRERSDKEDESWWPRGRLGRLVPRMNRPSRRGTRREAVQAALRAARLRGASEQANVSNDSSTHPILPSQRTSTPNTSHSFVETNRLPKESINVVNVKKTHKKKKPAKSIKSVSVQHILPSPTSSKTPKFKKGMKTAKQRLGKILKIHRMMC